LHLSIKDARIKNETRRESPADRTLIKEVVWIRVKTRLKVLPSRSH
jgi:hypothetical protein